MTAAFESILVPPNDGMGAVSGTVRSWQALGGKLPFQFGSTGKVCLDRFRPSSRSFVVQ